MLVRCDFNVPLIDGKITDENRLVAALPTIKKLVADGGKIILCSHLGKPKGQPVPELSLAPVAARLTELLGQEVKFAADAEVKVDFTPVYLMVDQAQIAVIAPMYGVEIEPDEIKSVEVIEELPDDSVTKTNGFADDKQLLGKFRGKEMGLFRAYIYKGYSPVLKIELTDTTIYINSKDSGDVKIWYRELNTLLHK